MRTTTSRPSPTWEGAVHTRRSTRPRLGRILLILLAVITVIGLLVGGYAFHYVSSLDDRIKREDPFAGIIGGRPPKTIAGAMNILVLGSDSRDGANNDNTRGVSGERSDSIMLIHVPEDHSKAQIISIPRDTYVFVPEYKGYGGRKAKINAAFAWGGATLTTMTVERFTGVKIDHVAKVDFSGFKKMTDAVGGVTVYVNKTVTDPRSKRTFQKGYNKLNGDQALDYVRQRYGLPRGDFDRVQRQQIFLRALMQKATDTGTLTDLPKLKRFLDATADAVTMDQGFQLGDMVLQFRKLRPGDLSFVTTPNLGAQRVGGQSVVVADKVKASALFEAVNQDKVDEWLKANPPNNVTAGR